MESVEGRVCSAECGVWRGEGMQGGDRGGWRAECSMRSGEREVECGVRSVDRGVWCAECEI